MSDSRFQQGYPPQPPQGDAGQSEVAALADQVRILTQHITQAPGTMRAIQPPQQAAPQQDIYDKIEDDFRPVNKVAKAVKWTAGIVIPIFMAGGAYYKFKHDVAMKADIEDHIVADLHPVRDKVVTIEHGVSTLLSEKKHERAIQRLERQLLKHQHKFEQLMADYRNARARQVWAKKPTKSDKHLDLESQLEDLLNAPVRSPVQFGNFEPPPGHGDKKK